MAESRQNLYVGLFVVIGVIFLGVLTVIFGAAPTALLGGSGYPLVIQFQSAAGIRRGNQVTVGGIAIGHVEEVKFIDADRLNAGVNVLVRIDREFQLPESCRAVTIEPGIGAGRPPIEIIPGPPTPNKLAAGATIPGEVRGAMESIIPRDIVAAFEKTATNVGEAAANLTPVLKDLHEIMAKRAPGEVDRPGGPQGNLSSAMSRFDASLKHFNEVLGDPETKSQLKESLANIHQITEDGKAATADLRAASADAKGVVSDAKTLVAKTQGTVERLDGEITSVGRDARDMLEHGSRLLQSLYEVSSTINRGEGTIGRLVKDPKLYDAMILTVERMGQALEEFRLLVKDWQKGKVRVAF